MLRLQIVGTLVVVTASWAGLSLVAAEPAAEQKTAKTTAAVNEGSPEAVAGQFVAALKKPDRKAYDAAVESSGLADVLFDFAIAAEAFKTKMLKAYGEEGWRNFQDSEGARITLRYNDANLEQLKFAIDGDVATATLPEGGGSLLMTRKDGRWKVDLEKSIEADAKEGDMNAKSLTEAFKGMVKTIREYEGKIGEGTTVDQLDKDMGAAFFAALLSAGAKPKVSVQVK